MAFKRWSGGGVRATAILDGVCARCHWAQAGRDGETALRSNKETGPKDRKILGQHTTFLTKCPIQGWAKARSCAPCHLDMPAVGALPFAPPFMGQFVKKAVVCP